MKTMPRPMLRAMRLVVEAVLTTIQRWEDKHADPDRPDYRMSQMNAGLWQASQSMKEIIEGDFQPMLRQTRLRDLPEAGVLGEAYHRELLGSATVPLHAVD
jgi:hypothetical protein